MSPARRRPAATAPVLPWLWRDAAAESAPPAGNGRPSAQANGRPPQANEGPTQANGRPVQPNGGPPQANGRPAQPNGRPPQANGKPRNGFRVPAYTATLPPSGPPPSSAPPADFAQSQQAGLDVM